MMRFVWAGVLALTTLGGPAPAAIEREARALETALIAPCCFTQQVSVHQSPAADEVRRDLRARLAAGQTRPQILDAYVQQYGKRILAEPPAEGFDLLLHGMPVLLLPLTAVLLVAAIRRFSRGRLSPSIPESDARVHTPLVSAAAARLDLELRELD